MECDFEKKDLSFSKNLIESQNKETSIDYLSFILQRTPSMVSLVGCLVCLVKGNINHVKFLSCTVCIAVLTSWINYLFTIWKYNDKN
jgi:uncharacterized membrane protein